VATVEDALGRYADAERDYLRIIAKKRQVIGDEHPDTCLTYFRLSQMYVKQERYGDAETAALAAYRGYSNRLGSDHNDTRRTVEHLAAIYDATGRPRDAEQWRAKAVRK
jgi:hypothetical protein